MNKYTKYAHPNFATFESRLESFKSFNRHRSLYPPEAFARAGLFYVGVADCVCCYYCGQGLRNWDFQDVPAKEHLRLSPNCKHMAQNVVDTTYEFQYNTESTVAVDVPSIDVSSKSQPLTFDPTFDSVDETSKPLWSEVAKAVPRATQMPTPRRAPPVQDPIYVQPTSTTLNKSAASKNVEEGFRMIEEYLANAATTVQNIKNSIMCKHCHIREANIMFLPCRHSEFCDKCVNPCANMCVCKTRIVSILKKERRDGGIIF